MKGGYRETEVVDVIKVKTIKIGTNKYVKKSIDKI